MRKSVVAAGSGLAFWICARWWDLAARGGNPLMDLFDDAAKGLPAEIVADPLRMPTDEASLLAGLMGFCATWLAWAYSTQARAQERHGDEYGSARRGSVSEATVYRDRRNPEGNIIVSHGLGIAYGGGPGVRKRLASRNVVVIGGTGAGKTTGFVLPNLLQIGAGADRIVVDPKGKALEETGQTLAEAGVDIRVFDTVNRSRSDVWNPLAPVTTHALIGTFVACLVENTNNGKQSTDPIWDNGEVLFYRALLTLMLDWGQPEDMNMGTFLMLTNMCDVAEGPGAPPSPLDLIFNQIETGRRPVPAAPPAEGTRGARMGRLPSRVAWEPSRMRRRTDGLEPGKVGGIPYVQDEAATIWHQFRHGAGKTLKSFVISSHARLAQISDAGVLELLGAGAGGRDDLGLAMLGQPVDAEGKPRPPRATFVTVSDFDPSLNSLLSLFVWEAIFMPMRAADGTPGGRLPRPVSLILDEFGNTGKLPGFTQCIAVVRSRNIDVSIMLQSLAQLDEIYGEHAAQIIRDNCPTTVYLAGGRSPSSAERISKEAGKATVIKTDVSVRGAGLTAERTRNRTSIARDVLDPHEVSTLPDDDALVLMGSKEPVVDRKAHVWDHPRYDPRYMAERPERAFDYEAWRAAGRPLGETARKWAEGEAK